MNQSSLPIAATATLLIAGIAQSAPALVPQPAQMTLGIGNFTLRADTVLVADIAPEKAEAKKFAEAIQTATGFSPLIVAKAPKSNSIVYRLPLTQFTAGAKYELRANVRSDGGNDSNGVSAS